MTGTPLVWLMLVNRRGARPGGGIRAVIRPRDRAPLRLDVRRGGEWMMVDRMEKHQRIIEYLNGGFPAANVAPRDYASALSPVFQVTEGSSERQLEIGRALADDLQPHMLVQLLEFKQVIETMRAQAGKRVVVRRRPQGEILVEVEELRKR